MMMENKSFESGNLVLCEYIEDFKLNNAIGLVLRVDEYYNKYIVLVSNQRLVLYEHEIKNLLCR